MLAEPLVYVVRPFDPSDRYRPRPWMDPPMDPLSERAEEEDGLLMKASRVLTFAGGTAAFSFLMHVLNK